MDASEILREIEEIEESLQWCSPEAKCWHMERLRGAKRLLDAHLTANLNIELRHRIDAETEKAVRE